MPEEKRRIDDFEFRLWLAMAAVKKFVRAINFTLEEEHRLLDVVETYIKVIECKRTDAFTWKEKNEKWKQVALDFNSGSSNKRSERELKLKYECLKKAARKEANRQKQLLSGSESVPLIRPRNTAVLERVLHLVPLSADGMLSKFDRDADSWAPRNANAESNENSDVDETQQPGNIEEELRSLEAPVFGALQPEWTHLSSECVGFAERSSEASESPLSSARTELARLQAALMAQGHEQRQKRLAAQHHMDLRLKEADLRNKEADLRIKEAELRIKQAQLELLQRDLLLRNERPGKEEPTE